MLEHRSSSSQIGTEEIDLSGLTSLAELKSIGEPDLVVELIDLYLKDGPERIQKIKTAAARADATGLRQAAHTLKGSSASLGFHQISEICEQLERLDWRDSHHRPRRPDRTSAVQVHQTTRGSFGPAQVQACQQ